MIEINRAGNYGIIPMLLPVERQAMLESHLMLFFTGIQRHASEIAKAQIDNTEQNVDTLGAITEQVRRAFIILKRGDMNEFGYLLGEGWKLKRQLSDKISSPEIDVLYTAAYAAGALGGKVIGAGGGGFMLFYVPLERQAAVREALGGLIDIPVKFEHRGSQVVINA